MMFLFVGVLVVGYAIVASWSMSHGLLRLWSTASLVLLLVLAGSVALGRHYAVPSMSQLLIYAAAFSWPTVLVPTTMLTLLVSARSAWSKTFPTAVAGACLGQVCGLLIVVLGLRAW